VASRFPDAGWSRFADILDALGRVGSAGESRTTRSMGNDDAVKYWEIIADNLSKAGWSWGCVSAIDSSGRTIWIADAHGDDGNRFVVHADEKLTAFLELESAIL
jgi:hypothetical protein